MRPTRWRSSARLLTLATTCGNRSSTPAALELEVRKHHVDDFGEWVAARTPTSVMMPSDLPAPGGADQQRVHVHALLAALFEVQLHDLATLVEPDREAHPLAALGAPRRPQPVDVQAARVAHPQHVEQGAPLPLVVPPPPRPAHGSGPAPGRTAPRRPR